MQARFVGLILIGISVCLAGCGRRQSPSSTVGLAIPFQGPNTTASYSASSAPATFNTATGLTTGFASPVPSDSANAATVTLTTDKNGNLTQLQISAPTGSGTFTQSYPVNNPFTTLITVSQLASLLEEFIGDAAGSTVPIYQNTVATAQGTVATLSSSAYGAWLVSNGGGNFQFGPFAFGVESTAAQIHALSGTATYSGSTFGVGAVSTTPFAFTGSANVGANFTTGTVTTTFSNFATANLSGGGSGPSIPTIVGAGTIGNGVAGNQYAGPLSGGGFTGNVVGTFYGGATAPEVGGAWQATNGAGTSLVGAFGAKQ